MRYRSRSILVFGTIAAALTSAAASAQTVTTVDVPGAASVTAMALNRKAQVVGSFVAPDRAGYPSGFLSDQGRIVRLDVPGAVSTVAHDINDRGQIVGTFTIPGDPGSDPGRDRGFLYEGGRFSTVLVPNAAGTRVNGINGRGEMVGEYFDLGPGGATGAQHGFFLSRKGEITEVAAPDAVTTKPLAVNDSGWMVGVYSVLDAGGQLQTYPFLFDGAFHRLDLPAGASPHAIDSKGNIAGTIVEGLDTGITMKHAFTVKSGTVSSFDLPAGPGQTAAYGLNDKGALAGSFVGTDGVNRGFVMMP